MGKININSSSRFVYECESCGRKVVVRFRKRIYRCVYCDKLLCEKCITYGLCQKHFGELPVRLQENFVKVSEKADIKNFLWKIIGIPFILYLAVFTSLNRNFALFTLPILVIIILFLWFNANEYHMTKDYKKKVVKGNFFNIN